MAAGAEEDEKDAEPLTMRTKSAAERASKERSRKRLSEDWKLPAENLEPKSARGTGTPSMWASASSMVWQRNRPRPGALDSVKTRKDAFGSLAHLATLAAVLLLIYVVVPGG